MCDKHCPLQIPYILLECFFLKSLEIKPGLHEQITKPIFAQFLDPYEVSLPECAQIKHVLFAHVNAALM